MTPSRKTSILRLGEITNIFDISHAIFIDITKIKTKENEINFDHLEEITRINYDTMTNKDDINGDFYNTPNDDEIQEISHRSRAQDVIDEVYSTIDEFILTISYIKFAIAGIVISSCIIIKLLTKNKYKRVRNKKRSKRMVVIRRDAKH